MIYVIVASSEHELNLFDLLHYSFCFNYEFVAMSVSDASVFLSLSRVCFRLAGFWTLSFCCCWVDGPTLFEKIIRG
jgi:hypothetical protein